MYGVIDIGSNTIRLSIYKVTNMDFKLMINKKHMTGLAGYVDEKGILTDGGIKRALDDLNDFRQIIENFELKDVYVFATASIRNIRNSELVLKQIGSHVGRTVDLVSGEQEAIYDFIGATRFMHLEKGLLVDIGGGSTELVSYENGQIVQALSIPIGSLNLYTHFVSDIMPSKYEVKAMKAYVKSVLNGIDLKGKGGTICGIGGTCRGICKLSNLVSGAPNTNRTITVEPYWGIYKEFVNEKPQAVRSAIRAIPDRLHTITPGMVILSMIIKKYDATEIVVSDYGIREGYLYKKLMLGDNFHAKQL